MGHFLNLTAHKVPQIDYPAGKNDRDAAVEAVQAAYRTHINALSDRQQLCIALDVQAHTAGHDDLFDPLEKDRSYSDEYTSDELDALVADSAVSSAVVEFWKQAITYVSGHSRDRSELLVGDSRIALYGGPTWGDQPMDEFAYADAMSLVPGLAINPSDDDQAAA